MIFLITPARGERKGERAAYEGWLRRRRWLEKSGWEGGTRRRVVRVGEKVAQGGKRGREVERDWDCSTSTYLPRTHPNEPPSLAPTQPPRPWFSHKKYWSESSFLARGAPRAERVESTLTACPAFIFIIPLAPRERRPCLPRVVGLPPFFSLLLFPTKVSVASFFLFLSSCSSSWPPSSSSSSSSTSLPSSNAGNSNVTFSPGEAIFYAVHQSNANESPFSDIFRLSVLSIALLRNVNSTFDRGRVGKRLG